MIRDPVPPRRPARRFDFTAAMRDVCHDLTCRVPQLGHIDVERMAMACAQTRKPVAHGLYATLTPMRFEGGTLSTVRHGRCYTAQRLYDQSGRELLYILRFYLPRFMQIDFLEKLTTVIHELWHVSPEFNGDLRRHEGRCYAHTHSQKKFDAQMRRLARRYLALPPREETIGFLRCSFGELEDHYGAVMGLKVPHPKLIPLSSGAVGRQLPRDA